MGLWGSNMQHLLSDKMARVLEQFIDGPKTLSQIQKFLGVSKTMALKTLSKLENDGLLSSVMIKNHIGQEKQFLLRSFSMVLSFDMSSRTMLSFVSDGPLSVHYPLLGQIVQERFRDALRTYLDAVVGHFKKSDYAIVVYGSVARGEGTNKSDLDLMVLSKDWTDDEKAKVRELLANVVHIAETLAKPMFWTFDKLSADDTMQRAVKKEGIIVYSQGEVEQLWQMQRKYKSISR
jgi:predicted nucleotidyltransferase